MKTLKIIFWAILFYCLISCEKRDVFLCGTVQEYRETINPKTKKVTGYYVLSDGQNIKIYHTMDFLSIGDTICLK